MFSISKKKNAIKKHFSYDKNSILSKVRCYSSIDIITVSSLLGKLLEPACRSLLQFSLKSISEVGHCCWAIMPGSLSAFHFILKGLDGVEVRALSSKFFYTKLSKPCFVHRVLGMHYTVYNMIVDTSIVYLVLKH